jgi:hypothetical protein
MTTELGVKDIATDLYKTALLRASCPLKYIKARVDELPDEEDVPDFTDDTVLFQWLDYNILNMNFSRGHMDISLCKPFLKAYIRFAKLYPEMALRNHVGTYNGDALMFSIPNALFQNRPSGGIAFSASAFIPNMGIYLNEVYFSDASKFYRMYEEWERVRWFPTVYGHGAESILVHELSHQLYAALNKDEQKGWEAFIVEHDADRRALSGYAMSMPRECFCEAIAAYNYGCYDDNSVVARAAELARRFQFNP